MEGLAGLPHPSRQAEPDFGDPFAERGQEEQYGGTYQSEMEPDAFGQPFSDDDGFSDAPADIPISKQPSGKLRKKSRAVSVISTVLFYVLLAILVPFVVVSHNAELDNGYFGYKFYCPKEASQYDDYAKGTVILVKSVDPAEVQKDANIAFYGLDQQIVTQRVTEIMPDYDQSGRVAFYTSGEGVKSDNTVMADYLLGISKLEIPLFGYLVNHFVICGVAFTVLMAVSFIMKLLWGEDREPSSKGGRGKKKRKPPTYDSFM